MGLVGTGTGVCGAELYYGNYMINTTRPWALSSPSQSSFQSRSSAQFLFSISGRNLAPLSRLRPRVFLLGVLSLFSSTFFSFPATRSFSPVDVSTSEHWRFALKYAFSLLARNAINLIPFRSRLLPRRLSQRDE